MASHTSKRAKWPKFGENAVRPRLSPFHSKERNYRGEPAPGSNPGKRPKMQTKAKFKNVKNAIFMRKKWAFCELAETASPALRQPGLACLSVKLHIFRIKSQFFEVGNLRQLPSHY